MRIESTPFHSRAPQRTRSGRLRRHSRRFEIEHGEAFRLARTLAWTGEQASNPDRHVAEQGAERRAVMALAGQHASTGHARAATLAPMVTCAGTVSAWTAAVGCFASARRRPRSARPAWSSRSNRASPTSAGSPACNSATSFTRHTSFDTGSPSSHEPKTYASRNKPHRLHTPPGSGQGRALRRLRNGRRGV